VAYRADFFTRVVILISGVLETDALLALSIRQGCGLTGDEQVEVEERVVSSLQLSLPLLDI
jgi:hypothetical protein